MPDILHRFGLHEVIKSSSTARKPDYIMSSILVPMRGLTEKEDLVTYIKKLLHHMKTDEMVR